ncbi:MAG: HAMP domain-containing protein, partial [Tissierellia bacterium]|nr:HAMP domain-containing protein [Tissierellia bacterium]
MSLRSKLTYIVVILGIVAIMISTYFMAGYNRRILIDDTLENNKAISSAISISIDNYLSELVNTTKTLASTPFIKEYVRENGRRFESLNQEDRDIRIGELNEKWVTTNDLNDTFIQDYISNPAAKYLREQFKVIPNLYGEIFITDRYGGLVASTTKLTTFSHGYKEWWLASYNDGKGEVFFDDRGYDSSVGDFVLGVVVPIYDDGEVIGILKSNMKIFSLFNETIKDYYSLYEPGLIRIARTDGKVLLEPDKQPLSTRIEEGLLSDIGKDMESKIYRDENDGEMLFSASPIKSTIRSTDIGFGGSHESIDHIRGNAGDNWMVILTTPAAIIDQKVLKLIKEFLLIGFLCIGFIAIFTLFFVRKITRNIIKLVDFTKEVDWRNLDRRIEVRTDDEIGALANSFNDMIVRLNRMMVSRMELMEEIDRRIEAEKKLQRLS